MLVRMTHVAGWVNQPELTAELTLGAADAAQTASRYETMDAYIEDLLDRVKDLFA